jgi:hypothetical protein
MRLRLAARGEPRDEVVARLDRRHVDFIAGHSGGSVGQRGANIHAPAAQGQ